MAIGRFNRRHKHGVLRKKFAVRQAKASRRVSMPRAATGRSIRSPRVSAPRPRASVRRANPRRTFGGK